MAIPQFPRPSRKDWLDIAGPLKRSHLAEGVELDPLFTERPAQAEGWLTSPGRAPYLRSRLTGSTSKTAWNILQPLHLEAPQWKEAFHDDLKAGIQGFFVQGIAEHTMPALAELIRSLPKDVVLELEPGLHSDPVASLFGTQADSISYGLDPLTTWTLKGALPESWEAQIENCMNQVKAIRESHPHLEKPLLCASSLPYHHAGAHSVQEIGITLATGLTYLRALMESGSFTLENASKEIQIAVALDSDFFLNLAKVRALRLSWTQMVKSIAEHQGLKGFKVPAVIIRAHSSRRMLSQRDPWVNLLRELSACFSGGASQVDALVLDPFDWRVRAESAQGRRLARNTHRILMEESGIHRVIDPSGGSYYLETLTATLAEAAWGFFQEIETKGGLPSVLREGWLQATLAQSQRTRDQALRTRKLPLTGVSEFPWLGEPSLKGAKPLLQQTSSSFTQDPIEALQPCFNAQPFEDLRNRSDQYKDKKGILPQIFLACLGPSSRLGARVQFAKNFFEAAGIEVLVSQTPEIHSVIKELGELKAAGVVLCASDEDYQIHLSAWVSALKNEKVKALYLAGKPGPVEKTGPALGIDHFIYLGADVITVAEHYLALLEEDA